MKALAKSGPRVTARPHRGSDHKTQFRGIPLLLVIALVVGVIAAARLGKATRHLARTEWNLVPELNGASLADLPLANGVTISLADAASAHVVYLFQTDCATCDAQRAHVAELLEAVPAGQAVSASAQAATLAQGYWSDLGSPLSAPLGADSVWLAAKHMDRVPLLLFVDKSGRVAKAIRGSLLSWSDAAVLRELHAVEGPT